MGSAGSRILVTLEVCPLERKEFQKELDLWRAFCEICCSYKDVIIIVFLLPGMRFDLSIFFAPCSIKMFWLALGTMQREEGK